MRPLGGSIATLNVASLIMQLFFACEKSLTYSCVQLSFCNQDLPWCLQGIWNCLEVLCCGNCLVNTQEKSKFSAADLLLRACICTWTWKWRRGFCAVNSTVNTSSSTVLSGFKCNGAQNVDKKNQPVLLCFKINTFTWLGQFQNNNNTNVGFLKHKTKCCNELLPVTIWF